MWPSLSWGVILAQVMPCMRCCTCRLFSLLSPPLGSCHVALNLSIEIRHDLLVRSIASATTALWGSAAIASARRRSHCIKWPGLLLALRAGCYMRTTQCTVCESAEEQPIVSAENHHSARLHAFMHHI
jgi:hypothetical protein